MHIPPAMPKSGLEHAIADETCLLCAGVIRKSQPTAIYAGIAVHTDCYCRDVGLPRTLEPGTGWLRFLHFAKTMSPGRAAT